MSSLNITQLSKLLGNNSTAHTHTCDVCGNLIAWMKQKANDVVKIINIIWQKNCRHKGCNYDSKCVVKFELTTLAKHRVKTVFLLTY